MKNIFIGFILVFLNFNLNLGNSKIGLIPDFVGYMVITSGLTEMARESSLFIKIKPYVTFMIVYSGVLYIFDMLGISVSLGALSYLLIFIATSISLYISYNIVLGVVEMEKKYKTLFNGDSLKRAWTFLAVFNILTFIVLLIPSITVILILISFIAAICFLVAFKNSKNLYYEMAGKSNDKIY